MKSEVRWDWMRARSSIYISYPMIRGMFQAHQENNIAAPCGELTSILHPQPWGPHHLSTGKAKGSARVSVWLA